MVMDLEDRLSKLGLDPREVDFQRVAVTLEQIDQHDLPWDPDDATEEKLMKKDSRTGKFIEKYGQLYAVELHALPALIPDVFKQQLVIDNVEQYFDQSIYQQLVDEYTPEDVNRLLKYKLRRLTEDEEK